MDYKKLSPELLYLSNNYSRAGHSGIQEDIGILGIVSDSHSPKPSRVIIFVYCDEQTNFSSLEQYGIRINRQKGAIRTAILPISEIDRLSKFAGVKRLEASRMLKRRMDVASQAIHLPIVRDQAALTGKGVVIGVVDTGIDPNHPAFEGRIHSIWDQTISGPGVAEGSYGFELSGIILNVSRDFIGHGSHVAGIAGGLDPDYAGVAPDAQFVIVKTTFNDAHIADGIEYIFRVAGELGMPAVVNLSLGGHADAHDGSDHLSGIIDQESGQGRIVCVAAGNEGSDHIHAHAEVKQDVVEPISFKVASVHDAHLWKSGHVYLDGWYSGQDIFDISIVSPNGWFTPWQGILADNAEMSYEMPDGIISITTPGANPINGDNSFLVVIEPKPSMDPIIATGNWSIKIRGAAVSDGTLDIWLTDRSNKVDALFIGPHATNKMTIGSPGCANQSITVGSMTSRIQWTDIDGVPREISGTLDTPSDFSSEGPLRNGGEKPDVCAPGEYICASLSADSQCKRHLMMTSRFRLMMGTSMATPIISGLIALLLEENPNLDPDTVKGLLKKASKIPNVTQGTHDTKWGYGSIDANQL